MTFTWLDLVAPWFVCLAAAALCIWGTIKAKAKPAKVISVITGLVFLAGIPTWYFVRSTGLKPVYKTTQGLDVIPGKLNKCSKASVEKWSIVPIEVWTKKYGKECVKHTFEESLLICRDEEKLSTFGRLVRGYSIQGMAIIGWKVDKPEYTRSLFIHEMSHLILHSCGEFWSENVHHKIFKENKLGY